MSEHGFRPENNVFEHSTHTENSVFRHGAYYTPSELNMQARRYTKISRFLADVYYTNLQIPHDLYERAASDVNTTYTADIDTKGCARMHARARGILASTLALPPNPCQKVEVFFNGWKRQSATMHTRKCMVPLGNLHGWTSELAWLDSRKCMVPLAQVHGSAFAIASNGHKSGFR